MRYYIALGSVVGLPGLWWMTKPTQDNTPLEPGPRKESKDQDQVTRILSQDRKKHTLFPVRMYLV